MGPVTDSTTWTQVGRGVPTRFDSPVSGSLCAINGAFDVIAAISRIETGELSSPIALVRDAGGTTIGPLLGDLVAVVSTSGGLGSHIALLCNEFGCPCVVSADLEGVIPEGSFVRVEPDGAIWAAGSR
jgi:phosphohistidine swiveling domain-containing protein